MSREQSRSRFLFLPPSFWGIRAKRGNSFRGGNKGSLSRCPHPSIPSMPFHSKTDHFGGNREKIQGHCQPVSQTTSPGGSCTCDVHSKVSFCSLLVLLIHVTSLIKVLQGGPR